MSYPDYGFGSNAANGDYHERLHHGGGNSRESGFGKSKFSSTSSNVSASETDFEKRLREENSRKIWRRMIITIVLLIICQPIGLLVGMWFFWYSFICGE